MGLWHLTVSIQNSEFNLGSPIHNPKDIRNFLPAYPNLSLLKSLVCGGDYPLDLQVKV